MKRLAMVDFEPCVECHSRMPIITKIKNKYYVMCINCEYMGEGGKTVKEAEEKWNKTK